MDANEDSNDQANPSTFLDICPHCESDAEACSGDGIHWAACTSCGARGPEEHNLRDVPERWNEMSVKVRAFERVREILQNAARVSA